MGRGRSEHSDDEDRARSEPAAGETYKDLAIGPSFAAAIRVRDGGIDTWGQFAGGTRRNPALPAKFLHLRFMALTVGGGHGVAITDPDQRLVQWGAGEGGEPKPRGVRFIEVRARNSYSLALTEKGSLYGWGGDELFHPLNISGTSASRDLVLAPVTHPLFRTGWHFKPAKGYWFHKGPFTAIAAGGVQKALANPLPHVLALRPDGKVVGWGADTRHERTNTPDIPLIAIAAGLGFSIGLDTSRMLHHWGDPGPMVGRKTGLIEPAPGELESVPQGPFASIGAATTHATAVRLWEY